ncbi:DUF6318 family protein [Cellulomonas soli]
MTAPTRRLLACAAAAATTLGLLTGCTGGSATADPTPVATASPAPSPTPTTAAPEAVAPQWTAAMDEVSPAGATAVLEYFFALYPYVAVTGDTAEWDRLSHPGCIFCASVSQRFGGKQSAVAPATPGLSQVSATELEPGVYFSIEASLTETHDDGTVTHSTVLAGVVREGNGWLIRAVQVDEVAAPDA